MGFQSSYSIPEFIDPHSTPKSVSTPIRPLSLYRPLRESHRPQGIDIDHFGYPCPMDSLVSHRPQAHKTSASLHAFPGSVCSFALIKSHLRG
ncbi:hypothetical protein T12_522 [Trichinella patagoniensis]|uniref:Uncharacterized protein n=1 Tax=Trichinella patagoniensis TaxID=990121 RepID=A0A0V0YZ07_9BILA|nr:hypothetical protein T12_522 [Trichinella patagoniensis]